MGVAEKVGKMEPQTRLVSVTTETVNLPRMRKATYAAIGVPFPPTGMLSAARVATPGRSGGPRLDAESGIDIAAAIGMMQCPSLDSDLLCHVYWETGAIVGRPFLDSVLRGMMLDEFKKRKRAAFEADMLAETAELLESDSAQELRSLANAAARERWPDMTPQRIPQIRDAVLHELKANNRCDACEGKGELRLTELAWRLKNRVPPELTPGIWFCAKCQGTGRVPLRKVERARHLDQKESTFRKDWCAPYVWLYDELNNRVANAVREFWRTLD